MLKNFLKKFIPPPTNVFIRETNRIIRSYEEKSAIIADVIQKADKDNKTRFAALSESIQKADKDNKTRFAALSESIQKADKDNKTRFAALSDLIGKLDKENKELLKLINILNKENSQYKTKLVALENNIKILQTGLKNCQGDASETVWAEIFNNVISDSPWLHNKAFSPGRWAVGYPYLYVMYRILNEIHPKSILELGLGQSTRMIGQYTMAHGDVEHFVIEHDPEWINFFNRDFVLCERSHITQMNLIMEPFKEAPAVRVYEGFEERFKNSKFDFISIDAPLGGDMKQYSRIDVLKLLPDCLAESFIIMIDDTGRAGETQTVREMLAVLDRNGISCCVGRKYIGKKECIVMSSKNLKFVCSM